MKKLLSVFIAVMLALALTACGGAIPQNTSCEEILAAAQSSHTPPDCEKLYEKSQGNLDAFSLSLWADGLYEECGDIELLDDYAIYIGAGSISYEIAVLKAKSKSDTAKLEQLIERRKATLSLGDRAMYDPDFQTKMDNSIMYSDGQLVIFLLTDDNDAALKKINELK